jgi:hypothetical protein
MTNKKINQPKNWYASLFFIAFCITALMNLVSCNLPSKPDDSDQGTYTNLGELSTPSVDITFVLKLPSSANKDEKFFIEILDIISGLANNNSRYELSRKNDQEYSTKLAFQSGSVIHYRYQKLSDGFIAEAIHNGEPVKYRLFHASGTTTVTDQVFSWQGEASQLSSGNLIGTIVDRETNQPIPDILVSAGGQLTFTDMNGQFVLDNLPEGTHNTVFYAINGQYRTYQQGAAISPQTNTIADVQLVAMRKVNVTLNVSGPSEAIGVPIHVAGNIAQLGNTFSDLPGSMMIKPKRMPILSPKANSTYTLDLQLYSETDLRFRFTLGDGFWNTERDDAGEPITRQLIVPAQDVAIDLNIPNWRTKGSEPITFQILFPPESAPPGEKYIQFGTSNWTEPIPLWPLGDSKFLYILFSPLDESLPIEYRFCRNEKCEISKNAHSMAENAVVIPSDEPQTLSLTVDKWENWQTHSKDEELIEAYIPVKPEGYAKVFEMTPQMDASWLVDAPIGIGELVDAHANTIIISPQWFFNPYSPFLQPKLGLTPFAHELTSLIDSTHTNGFSCGIFPQISTPLKQGVLWPSTSHSEAWWEMWFNSYRQYILSYAKLSEITEAEQLYLGGSALLPAFSGGIYPNGGTTDIPNTSEQWWSALITDIKEEYTGELVWVTSAHQTMDPLPDFIDEFDGIYISIDSPLAPADASSFDAIGSGFTNVIDSLIYEVYRSTGQPITIALAYPSVTNAVQGCLLLDEKCVNDGIFLEEEVDEFPVDLSEQALIYNAILPIITSRPWITGISIRGYDPTIISLDGSSSIAGKPTLDIIEYWFKELTP